MARDGRKLRPYFTPTFRAADLAERADVSTQFVYDVLAGKRSPSPKILEAARELGVPVDEIYPHRARVAA